MSTLDRNRINRATRLDLNCTLHVSNMSTCFTLDSSLCNVTTRPCINANLFFLGIESNDNRFLNQSFVREEMRARPICVRNVLTTNRTIPTYVLNAYLTITRECANVRRVPCVGIATLLRRRIRLNVKFFRALRRRRCRATRDGIEVIKLRLRNRMAISANVRVSNVREITRLIKLQGTIRY